MQNIFSIAGLLVTITCLILSIIILWFRKTKVHHIWLFSNISIAIWGFGCFIIGKANSHSEALMGWKVAHLGGLMISILFYHLVFIFCNTKNRKLLFLAYFQAFVIEFFNIFTNTFINNIRYAYGLPYPTSNFLYLAAFSLWVLFAIIGHLELLKFYRKQQGLKQIQALYLLVGYFIGFLGGGSVLLPIFNINIFYPFGNLLIVVYSLLGTYAILRYRLLDIGVAITRTGIFVAVYTIVLGLPFAAAFWFKDRLIDFMGSNWWMAPLGLMAVLATVGPFIYIFVERRAEDALLKEQKRYQNTLKQASLGMTRIRNLQRLLNLIAHIVTKTVRISYAAVYLYNKDSDQYVLQVSRDKGRQSIPTISADNMLIKWMLLKRDPLIYEEVKRKMEDAVDSVQAQLEEQMRILTASVVIPSFLEDRLLGVIILGDKISGQIYTPEDLNVFQVLASQAALAIENAQFYEEAKEMQAQIAQAEKMATVGTMADGLSHQINNRFYALSLIAGDSIDTIKMTDTKNCSPEIQSMLKDINYALERIQTNVIQGGEVVKGILKYTRKSEEGGLEAITIDQILDGTLDMVQYKVKLNEIDLIRDYPKETPKIKGNLVQLEEAFFNFIDNAYDAIVERRTTLKEEGYRGRITVTAKPKSEQTIEIIIEDNGMGIKDNLEKKVFTPFFTTKISSRKGTGLGLYVIRRIITEMHKGKLAFESRWGVGTRFILELPIAN